MNVKKLFGADDPAGNKDIKFLFRRGDEVKSIKDGVVGIVAGFMNYVGGVDMYEVSILKHESKQEYPGECTSITIDGIELRKIGECSNPEYIKPFEANFKFGLTQCLKHKHFGMSGIVTHRYIYANGCKHYRIATGLLGKDNEPVAHFYPEEMLEAVPVEKKAAEPKTKQSTEKKTGGPRDRMPARF